ncbi:MAG: hypothetical protein HHAS10_04420 [Candidatus Altimarinota bacterium]
MQVMENLFLIKIQSMSNLYEFALEEYKNEQNDSQDKIIFAYFGLAIYKGQCLEKEFENMLWIKNIFINNVTSLEEFDDLVNEVEGKRHTMGKQINELKKIYSFSEKIEMELIEVLEMRNYLIHKYFKENIQKLSSMQGIKETLKYFTDFIERASLLDKELQIYTDDYKKKLGITDEKLNIIINNLKNKERLRDA